MGNGVPTTSHLCSNVGSSRIISGENNSAAGITSTDTAEFTTGMFGAKKCVLPPNTAHVPDLRTNLLFSEITDSGCEVMFKKYGAEIVNKDCSVVLRANRIRDLYYVGEPKRQRSPQDRGIVAAPGSSESEGEKELPST